MRCHTHYFVYLHNYTAALAFTLLKSSATQFNFSQSLNICNWFERERWVVVKQKKKEKKEKEEKRRVILIHHYCVCSEWVSMCFICFNRTMFVGWAPTSGGRPRSSYPISTCITCPFLSPLLSLLPCLSLTICNNGF